MVDRVISVSDDTVDVEAEPVVLDITESAVQFTFDDGTSVVFARGELERVLPARRESEAA